MEKNIIFVSNYLSNSVSILNGTDDSVLKTVPVGNLPIGVKINPVSNKVYVSNIGSNTVSIINETSYKKVKDTPVNPSLIVERGNEYPYITPTNIKFPLLASFIGIDPLTNFVYVTNTASNAISVIDGKTDENIVRVGFETQPVNAGFVECNGIKNGNQNTTIVPTNRTNICNAVSERGYTFNSWSGLVASDENPLKFNSSVYGNIVAHFRPTLSYEQYVFLIGGVTGISSVLLGWFFKGRQRRTFNKFVQIVNRTVELSDFGNKKESIIQFGNLRRNCCLCSRCR